MNGKSVILFAITLMTVVTPICMKSSKGGKKPSNQGGNKNHNHGNENYNQGNENYNQAPKLPCPANILTVNEPGMNFALVNFTVPAFNGRGSQNDKINCSMESGSEFMIGTTEVICAGNGNTLRNNKICSFNVTVIDGESPYIVCPEDILMDLPKGPEGLEIDIPEPLAMDNAGEVVAECTHSGTVFLPSGITPVTCVARDEAGNENSCCFEVIITPVRNILDTLCTPAGANNNIGFQCPNGCVDLTDVALCNGIRADVTCGNDEDPDICDFGNDLPCSSDLLDCQNGGSCVLNDCVRGFVTDDCVERDLVAECICPPGFNGPNCQFEEGSCDRFDE